MKKAMINQPSSGGVTNIELGCEQGFAYAEWNIYF